MLNRSQRIIGLTGGIGSGKTTISNYLSQKYQIPVLDADIYSREAVQPNSPILDEIVRRYGSGILLPDRTLKRKLLGEIIFNNPEEKIWLESIIHPYVRSRFESELSRIKADTVILVVPLLFEANMTNLVTEIWVVRCLESEQIRRIMERDLLDEQSAIARIKNQLPPEKKIAAADLVIDNFSDVDTLLKQVDAALLCR
jgi:dephospho-CoA kinase